jgi:hypothetical protein
MAPQGAALETNDGIKSRYRSLIECRILLTYRSVDGDDNGQSA